MDIGRLIWEIQQKEKEFQEYANERLLLIYDYIRKRGVKPQFVPQGIPRYKNGKVIMSVCEQYPYKLIDIGEYEVREFIKEFCKKRRS